MVNIKSLTLYSPELVAEQHLPSGSREGAGLSLLTNGTDPLFFVWIFCPICIFGSVSCLPRLSSFNLKLFALQDRQRFISREGAGLIINTCHTKPSVFGYAFHDISLLSYEFRIPSASSFAASITYVRPETFAASSVNATTSFRLRVSSRKLRAPAINWVSPVRSLSTKV